MMENEKPAVGQEQASVKTRYNLREKKRKESCLP